MEEVRLIVGLGNPGKSYENTRHNIGFRALDAFAEKHSFSFQKQSYCKGELAKGKWGSFKLLLLKPLTFMNLSGDSVLKVVEEQKIETKNLIVLVDDSEIGFGQLRIRGSGSSGGHNGLKSIEESLQTTDYARFRIGIGRPQMGDLADFVLRPFSSEEEKQIPEILKKTVQSLEIWLDQGLTSAMNLANRGSSTPSIGEKKDEEK